MFKPFKKSGNREIDDKSFLETMNDYLSMDDNTISTLSNAAALLYWYLDDVSWVGFYLDDGERLFLSPFQGPPACTLINYDKGVCGKSFVTKKVIRVEDVNKFPGHIACSSDTQSEIVLPLIKNNVCFGVLDIDSNSLNRFSTDDETFLEECTKLIISKLQFET